MSEIVKICKKHGELTKEQVLEEKSEISFLLRCRECRKEYERNRRKRPPEYKEQVKKNSREWRRKNSDLVNKRVADKRKKDPERFRNYDRKWRAEHLQECRLRDVVKKHNIDYESYIKMFEDQKGLCAICGNAETRRSRTEGEICRLAVDHNHKTGKIRKLVCHNCNQVIGHSLESIRILKNVISYLEEFEN